MAERQKEMDGAAPSARPYFLFFELLEITVQMKSSHAGNRPIPSSGEPGQDIPR